MLAQMDRKEPVRFDSFRFGSCSSIKQSSFGSVRFGNCFSGSMRFGLRFSDGTELLEGTKGVPRKGV